MRNALRRVAILRARLKARPMPTVLREIMILSSRFVAIGYAWIAVTGIAVIFPFMNEHGMSLPGLVFTVVFVIAAQLAWEFQEIAKTLSAERSVKQPAHCPGCAGAHRRHRQAGRYCR